MKASSTFALLSATLIAAPAYAQVAGTWKGETQGRGGGAQEVTLVLTVTDWELTGTFTDAGGAQEIAGGAIAGDTITFTRELSFGGRGAFEMTYRGELDGDELTLTLQPPEGRGGGGRGAGGGARGAGGGRGGFFAPIVLTRE